MTDRVLTLWQPHASLVMTRTPEGGCLKDVENRPRPVPSTLPQWYRCEDCGHRERALSFEIKLREHHHGVASGGDGGWHPMVPGGPYPFRLWIHAGKTVAAYGDAWDTLGEALGCDGYELWHEHVASPDYQDGEVPWLHLGRLLGSVLVTGQHHRDESKNPRHLGDAPRWCEAADDFTKLCSPWAVEDQYHITVTDPQPLPEPIPMRGRQGWWRLPADVAVPA